MSAHTRKNSIALLSNDHEPVSVMTALYPNEPLEKSPAPNDIAHALVEKHQANTGAHARALAETNTLRVSFTE